MLIYLSSIVDEVFVKKQRLNPVPNWVCIQNLTKYGNAKQNKFP